MQHVPEAEANNDEVRPPLAAFAVAGTQAEGAALNKLVCAKLSQLSRTRHDEDSEDEEPEDKVPLLIELFTELKELTEADDTASNGHWRVRNYTKMINALNKYHSNGWPAITRAADYEQILADVRSDRVRGGPL